MSQKLTEKDKQALEYHAQGRPGKIEVVSTKPSLTSRDLALAYSPGVAAPCLEIAREPDLVYKYTAKGNLVGVISNGTAVLGLGNIGALAGKPVMEGKGMLFKRFADIDVFDIEVNESTVEGMVRVVKALEPTFGGINLEDIKAPECFEIEAQLIEQMNIPVFHDDQHGTAIIASAAFINALELTQRKIEKTKVVFSGAGAAAIACARIFVKLGIKKENIFMCDSQGVVYKGRTDGMNKYKEEFMVETSRRTLADAMKDADAFIGCSAKGVLTKDMVKTMAKNPIIFAMANPHPEILPEEVAEVRDDAIMATGRSDYPNQVNNVLGFPFIFRGALDVRASKINEEMKLAAIYALASLAKEEVPEDVRLAYGNEEFKFGRNYLIPKPFDKRVLTKLAPAVAKAAMDSGVARIQIADLNLYAQQLEERLGTTAAFVRSLKSRISVKQKPRIAFAEGISERVLRAVSIVSEHNIVTPVLLGKKEEILERMDRFGMPYLKNLEIVTPETDNRYEKFSDELYNMRQRKGISWTYARELMTQENYFGSMLVKNGFVDGMITGVSQNYPECFRAIASVIPTENHSKACGTIILAFKNRVVFLADCTVQVDPNGEELSDIAIASSNLYKKLMLKDPRVAFLSFSNFGSSKHPRATKMLEAVELTRKKAPNLTVDGEMQADVAVNEFLMRKMFDFSVLDKPADVLIFPDLASANIAYKLLVQLGKAISVGPIITSMQKAINIVQRTSTVEEIVNMTTVTALMAQEKKI